MLESAAVAGITGGGVHDANIDQCAMKAKVEAIYTWNLKHFSRLGADIATLVKTP